MRGTEPGTSPVTEPADVGHLTLQTILDRAISARPAAEALVGRSGRLTFAELEDEANRAANALLALGVRPGDRVAVSLPNDVAVVVTLLAVGRIGAVWVGINRHLAGPEKAFIVADTGAVVVIGDRETISSLMGSEVSMPELRRHVVVGEGDDDDDWTRLVASASAERPDAEIDPLQMASIAYTSGTTGLPKGVMHCHRALVMQGAVFTATRGLGSDSRYGIWMPLCNLQSMMMSVLTMAQVAGTTVVIDRADAVTIATWVDREGITHLPSVATILNDLTSSSGVTSGMLRTLRDVTAGGSDIPPSVVERFRDLTGVSPSVGYGQTEAAGAISMTGVGAPAVPGAAGRLLPHLEATIVGSSGPVLDGEVGELCIKAAARGPWAGLFVPMLGYWRRPEETAAAMRDGWLHTGDLCSVSSGGDLLIRGRKTQMILRGGANVYPAEVERVLLSEDGVDSVAVFGIPDERLGERVVAIVSGLPGRALRPESCIARCRAQLARYKCPDTVVVVDELPRNATGKVVRLEAQRLFAERTGAASGSRSS